MREFPHIASRSWRGALILLIVLGASILLIFGRRMSAQNVQIESRTARLNGIDLCFRVAGTGPTLVLLHGFTASGETWMSFVPQLAQRYQVIVPDLRGHGCSTNPTKTFTHRQAALDVYALLDSLGVQAFKAVGSSTGGNTLLHMATQQPSRVEAMVLISAAPYFPDQARKLFAEATVESMTPEMWASQRRIHPRGDEQIRALREQLHGFKDSYDDMNFTPPYLSTISARTMIIYGDRDQAFPVEVAVEMYRSIPHAQLFIIPNAEHGINVLNGRMALMPIVMAFLSGPR